MPEPLVACDPELSCSVSASAGSGKTWLLVSRLLRCLLLGVEPQSILAITFTRKAAAEMQARLMQRLYELACLEQQDLILALQAIGLDADTQQQSSARSLYETLLRSPRHLNITTFHSFSQQILRRFSLEADVPAGFELIEKTGLLEIEAWDALFADATANPDSEIASALELLFVHCNGLHGTQQALNSFLAHRSDWWSYIEGKQDPIEFACVQLTAQLHIDPQIPPDLQLWLVDKRTLFVKYTELMRLIKTKTSLGLLTRLEEQLSNDTHSNGSLAAIASVFLTKQKTERIYKLPALEKKMGDERATRFLTLHHELCTQINEFTDLLARHATMIANKAWLVAGSEYLRLYQHIKRQQRLLDFTDLEWQACKLINHADHAQWIQYKLDQRIDHLLIDEFQDTNPTQWNLLLPLLEELAAGESERQRSVFIVGDAKQSIYGFRRADAGLFNYARDWLNNSLAATNTSLSKSWRSAPAIMDFVNMVFSDGPLHDYLPDFTTHHTEHEKLWGKVTLLPLSVKPEIGDAPEQTDELRNPMLNPRLESAANAHDTEAALIAGQIKRLVAEQTPLADNHGHRPVEYGDIMILLRKRTYISRYEHALQHAGIPYQGSDPGSLLDSVEIKDMLALLDTLIAPYGNLSLARVLRSPLFACSEQDLVEIVQHSARNKALNWFTRLAELKCECGSPLARAQQLLPDWHMLAGQLPVHDLLDRIYCEGDVLARYQAAFPDHLRGRAIANLLRFLELALEIDSGRYPSLSQFRARLAAFRKQDRDGPDPAISHSGDSRVQIMTIHGAKGLEAPIVFLADTASQITDKPAYSSFVKWPSGAPQPALIQLILPAEQRDSCTNSLLENKQAAMRQEDANLLYVAVTRARQLLYISAAEPARGSNTGWYGQIREQLMQQLQPATDGSLQIESNTPPPLSSESVTHTQAATIELDSYLLQAATLLPVSHEIAPSHNDNPELNSHRPQATAGVSARLRGLIIHRILDKVSSQQNRDDLASELYAKFSDQISLQDFENCWQEAITVFEHPDNAALFTPTQFRQAWNEVPLIYRQDAPPGNIVHGVIDRLIRYDDHLLIIDYKTRVDTSDDAADRLANDYRQQLRYYVTGIGLIWPDLSIRACILHTSSNRLIPVDTN